MEKRTIDVSKVDLGGLHDPEIEALKKVQPPTDMPFKIGKMGHAVLVVRDIDVLQRFHSVRINVSIPTDSEEVRLAFEPKAPPLERRWQALEEVKASGLPVGVCITPMLPLQNVEAFVERITALGPAVVVTQDFHDAGSGFGAGVRSPDSNSPQHPVTDAGVSAQLNMPRLMLASVIPS